MIEWITSNKELLFSGIGVAILVAFLGWLFQRRKNRGDVIQSTNRSVAAKTITNSHISTGDTKSE